MGGGVAGGGGQRWVTVQLWIGFPGKRQVHLFSHLARDRGRLHLLQKTLPTVVLIFRERRKSSEPHTARSGWRPEGR